MLWSLRIIQKTKFTVSIEGTSFSFFFFSFVKRFIFHWLSIKKMLHNLMLAPLLNYSLFSILQYALKATKPKDEQL